MKTEDYPYCELVCKQCWNEYKRPVVAFWEPDGFCSDYCMKEYDKSFDKELDQDEEEE